MASRIEHRRRAWAIGLAFVAGLMTTWGASASASSSTTTSSSTTSSTTSTTLPSEVLVIQAQEAQVVSDIYQIKVNLARHVVDTAQAAQKADTAKVASDQDAESAANSAVASMTSKSVADGVSLVAATRANIVALFVLAQDRARLRAIAIEMYVGGIPTTAGVGGLSQQESDAQAFATGETTVVSETVISDLGIDEIRAQGTATLVTSLTSLVDADATELRVDKATAANTAAILVTGDAKLTGADRVLSSDQAVLTTDLSKQQHAVSQVTATSTNADGLSILGPSALTSAQLVGWYNANGYFDLTPAPVTQLANWYTSDGKVEGVRGDVAFAQAILETGGFSSNDAVSYNNYAGIGHCDSCSSGWVFPSPSGGVLGHLQLLRIFADKAGPPATPAPVLPALSSSQVGVSGCCTTWESLTGVWATDPTYGSQILSIYEQMLSYALSTLASSTPPTTS